MASELEQELPRIESRYLPCCVESRALDGERAGSVRILTEMTAQLVPASQHLSGRRNTKVLLNEGTENGVTSRRIHGEQTPTAAGS
jgi:hypothetical protein